MLLIPLQTKDVAQDNRLGSLEEDVAAQQVGLPSASPSPSMTEQDLDREFSSSLRAINTTCVRLLLTSVRHWHDLTAG
jgi:hypothetical protein